MKLALSQLDYLTTRGQCTDAGWAGALRLQLKDRRHEAYISPSACLLIKSVK